MMKTRTIYRCTSCGHVASKWMGKCPSCNTWESMIEEVDARTTTSKRSRSSVGSSALEAKPVALVDVRSDEAPRMLTGMPELDRVLGGGLVPGSVVLVGGDPGMGKSTLTLQLASVIGQRYGNALYVTGEESLHQIKQRADRLSLSADAIVVASETNIERIAALIESMQPQLVVIDSVQTMVTDLLESSAGSVAQVRECTALLTRIAKRSGIPVILIGHVTKDGMIAGPKVLEHMVDTVLQFEGEGTYSYRVLRALKNRYGSTNEIGVFDMQSTGLLEVPNPSEVLLSNRRADEPGTAVVAVMEGTRPLLVEVQALVSASGYNVPQRVSSGYDSKRLQLILAVLEKRGGVQVRQSDVFVNIAGGIAIQDPAIDLGVAVALASSVTDTAVPQGCAFVGELGLTGEIRRVAYLEQRVQEALRLGMTTVYVPPTDKFASSSIVSVERLSHVLSALFR
ncbi:MAG: DNA repair protein RadA [Ignavibacteriae bacterium]|nr:MAG: DNA repair protein RadA [Ignavibacteriota bacterium]